MHRAAAILAILLLVLTLSACGDDEDGDGTATPSATPATASPTPAGSPTGTARPNVEQLSYVGTAGDIRIVEADGSGDRALTDTPCDAGQVVQELTMAWAPGGAALGYVCASDVDPVNTLHVLGADGVESARVDGVTRFRWSPDGGRIAYQTATAESAFVVGLLDLETDEPEVLNGDAVLMEWAGAGALLLGLEPVAGDLATEFKANLMDVASGELVRLERMDRAGALWVSPDGSKAIVLTEERNPEASGVGMAVYDLDIDFETPIEGGFIGYPSEFIPHEQLAFTADGRAVFWVNAASAPSTVWTASLDEAEAEELGEVDSLFVAVSPSGRVAAMGPEQGSDFGVLYVHDPAAGTKVEVGEGRMPFAWRTEGQ